MSPAVPDGWAGTRAALTLAPLRSLREARALLQEAREVEPGLLPQLSAGGAPGHAPVFDLNRLLAPAPDDIVAEHLAEADRRLEGTDGLAKRGLRDGKPSGPLPQVDRILGASSILGMAGSSAGFHRRRRAPGRA